MGNSAADDKYEKLERLNDDLPQLLHLMDTTYDFHLFQNKNW